MLSLGTRDEGRKGIGIGFRSREGAMEENELEEGEAFSGHEDDACIDPDIALSYIDEKIQDVLGHFQKDFEGGVSAENLGAKFGGYGSFLPAYQRSPSVLSQPRSPPRPPNHTASKSPHNSSAECVRQNPSVPARSSSVPKNSTALLAQPGESSKKEDCLSSLTAGGCIPNLNSSNTQANVSNQKSLKVRIKVGPDNTLARSNAAIYSGLGLDTSPSSSPDDSPDASLGHSPGFRGAPGESPLSILEVMTCFSVPGGYLLSPLHENLFQLSGNESVFGRKPSILGNGAVDTCPVSNMALPSKDMKGYLDKKNKLDVKTSRSTEEEDLNCKGAAVKPSKKEMDVDAPASKKVVSNALSVSLQSCSMSADPKGERQIASDAAKDSSRALSILKELNNSSGKDKLSLSDSANDDQCTVMGNMKNGGGSFGDEIIYSKGKLNSKTTLLEKDIEERNQSKHKDTSSDAPKEGKSKNKKSHDSSKLSSDDYKGRNDHAATNSEPTKQMPVRKVSSHEKDGEKMLQGNSKVSEGKRRQKGSRDNHVPSVESVQCQGNVGVLSSLVPKEKKKSSHARGDYSDKKSKMLKSRKDTNRSHSREPQRDVVGNVNAQRVETRTDMLEPIIFTEKSMERTGVKKDVNTQLEPVANASLNASSVCAAPADASASSNAPLLVIKENWVCCDRCQKWRLLPYGEDLNNLSTKKWKCSMQVWLPGLNKCSISEEETKEAFNAMYLFPAPVSGANLNGHYVAPGINSTDAGLDNGNPSVPITGKKMSGLIGTSHVPKNSALKKNIQSSVKSRSLTDVGENPLETNSLTKAGLGIASKPIEFSMEKHNYKDKEKQDIPARFSDGDFVGRSGKHSKSKSKREGNQDGHRASKKIKKESLDHLVEDRFSDLDMTGRAAPDLNSGLSAKISGKVLLNCSDHSSSKDSKSEQRGILSASNKKSKEPIRSYSNGDFKDNFRGSDAEKPVRLDYAAKKRKGNERLETQAHLETLVNPQHALDSRFNAKEALSEGEMRKQKKAKVSKHEGRESITNNADGKADKKGCSTRILFSGSREQPSCGTSEERRVVGKEQMGYQETQEILDGNDPIKRDTSYAHFPTAATSSSSKVSGSRKSKASLPEARGSPVESVSSSPLRISTAEKMFVKRNLAKEEMVNLDSSFMGSPKRCSDGELGSDQSGTLRKEIGSTVQVKSLESNGAAESGVLHPMGGTCHLEKEASHLSGGNNKDAPSSKRGARGDLLSADFEVTNAVGDNKYLFDRLEKDNVDDDPANLNRHRRSNGTTQRKADKSSSSLKERIRGPNSDENRGKLKVSNSAGEKKESYSTKNGSSFRSEADCNDTSNHHEDSRDDNCSLQEKDEGHLGKKNSSAKKSYFERRDNHVNNGSDENMDAQNKDFNSRVPFMGAGCKSNLQEHLQQAPSYPSENPVSQSLLNNIDRSMASGRGISQAIQASKDKTGAHNSGQETPMPFKGRSDPYPTDAANGDASKMTKQSRKPDNQNGMHPSSLRQATPNGHDSSPMRKDGSSVARDVLKEARDLKHSANRLKNEGLHHESIGLYFQAALKFLHHAFLLEPSSAENAKYGEMNQSVPMLKMYSDTARLCEYVAHEYERHKEMAAAALAYKCVEVAYMKVAYYKNPAANKDRHELQLGLQAGLPGESPSSSASDVDNLNNQGALDKTASAKAACSPQVAGNHVIAARNRPSFMRLLSYTNDLNCAFDATKRSQNAIAMASVNLEKDGVDGMSSVRKVLDFNFHNVEGLLRLVRLSMESIGR